MQLDGTITIEVRHSKEEPPALVEQMRALRLAELDITKQRQQRYASKVQAKEASAGSGDAADGEQPLSTRARRRRRKKAAQVAKNLARQQQEAAQDAKILALQQQLADAGLASATAPAPAAPAAAPASLERAPRAPEQAQSCEATMDVHEPQGAPQSGQLPAEAGPLPFGGGGAPPPGLFAATLAGATASGSDAVQRFKRPGGPNYALGQGS